MDAPRAPAPHRARDPHARLRQGREPEPGRVGEGPHRPLDHRGRRAAGRAEAGRRDRRGHERQHRHRPRDRRRDQGLPLHLHDPRQDVEREDPAAPRLRGRGHRRADRGAAGPPGVLHPEGEDDRGADARGHLRGPALQPGQPGGALPHDGTGDLGADEGEDHALRLLARDRRNGHRRRPVPQGEEPRGEGGRGRPGGLDLHRVRPLPREGAGRAVQGGGHRRGQDPDLARLRRGGRVDDRHRRRRLPHRAPAHPRGGDLHRGLGRAERATRPSRWRGGSTIPRPSW